MCKESTFASGYLVNMSKPSVSLAIAPECVAENLGVVSNVSVSLRSRIMATRTELGRRLG
jgi:hypothetical protein